ncbi:glycosyltransferase [Adlercreutzia sp. ZJ154]|uniref:glycosyltransferase n=1 Tax=Adlercreutzia sp. ZJ154 TaxID=2709790 RepID=UPI0013EB1C56|nr:glycosyltransferase [Adlercreutzia sp. ZJ154]
MEDVAKLIGKRIVFFIMHLGVGGAQKVAAFVMNELVNQGADVYTVCFTEKQEHVKLSKEVKRVFIGIEPFSPAGSNVFKKISIKTKAIVRFSHIIKNIDPDCVVMFGPELLSNLALTLSRYKGAVIECERGDIAARGRVYRGILKKYVKKCDAAVFQFPGAMKGYGINLPEKTFVIPNPCSSVKDNHNSDVDRAFGGIVSVGRLVPEKGFVTLIYAFKMVHDIFPDKHLTIYGEGPDRIRLLHIIDKIELSEFVHLPGEIENPSSLISKAELFVLSSEYEGLPNTLIEAMSLGVPVVATDCAPGGACFLTDCGTIGGPLVPPSNSKKMATAIIEMLRDRDKAEQLGAAGKKICDLYSPSMVSDLWLNLFEFCLCESRR